MEKTRNKYSDHENRKMWMFLYEKLKEGETKAYKPLGNGFWELYVSENRTDKTVSSLATHFRRILYSNLHKADLTKKKCFFIMKELGYVLNQEKVDYLREKYKVDCIVSRRSWKCRGYQRLVEKTFIEGLVGSSNDVNSDSESEQDVPSKYKIIPTSQIRESRPPVFSDEYEEEFNDTIDVVFDRRPKTLDLRRELISDMEDMDETIPPGPITRSGNRLSTERNLPKSNGSTNTDNNADRNPNNNPFKVPALLSAQLATKRVSDDNREVRLQNASFDLGIEDAILASSKIDKTIEDLFDLTDSIIEITSIPEELIYRAKTNLKVDKLLSIPDEPKIVKPLDKMLRPTMKFGNEIAKANEPTLVKAELLANKREEKWKWKCQCGRTCDHKEVMRKRNSSMF